MVDEDYESKLERLRASNPFYQDKIRKAEERVLAQRRMQDECFITISAATALAKMAGKKKAAESHALQIEVETEMQWRTLLRREGLIVVDVYASWAGPCMSMVSILKRVKVEVNDDHLWLAVACSDEISDLLMFKDQSEPTWLFIGGGKPVKVFRGSNAPKLTNLIKSELENELLCMQGKAKRALISIDDEVSRRKKAEAEAQKLAKMIKDEDEAAKELNELRKESSIRLMDAMEPFTVLVIQNFLLETGAVTEIRDYLLGEFKIEQERYVSLNEDGVRGLFRIPYDIPDPNEPEDYGYIEPEETGNLQATSDAFGGENGSFSKSPMDSFENNEVLDQSQVQVKPPTRKKKMIPVKLPAGLVGDTLIMLLESLEIRKMITAGKKPDPESLLQTADDYIQLKVGPVDYKDAMEHSPYSLHAIYGKETYLPGVWCPRRYDDKRYVMINFFPRFVTEMLMPAPKADPKYTVAIFTADKAAKISKQLENHKKDLLADGKVTIPAPLVQQMLVSNHIVEGEKYEKKKAELSKPVYAISVDRRNSEIMLAVSTNEPIHVSVDKITGKIESAKLFTKLEIKLDDMPNPDTVVEKFLARSTKRVPSIQKIEVPPKPSKRLQDDSTTSVSSKAEDKPVKPSESKKGPQQPPLPQPVVTTPKESKKALAKEEKEAASAPPSKAVSKKDVPAEEPPTPPVAPTPSEPEGEAPGGEEEEEEG